MSEKSTCPSIPAECLSFFCYHSSSAGAASLHALCRTLLPLRNIALLSNSSISEWLTLNLSSPPTLVQPCLKLHITELLLPNLTEANCSQVCNDSTSLLYFPSNDLVTCGIFTVLSSAGFFNSRNDAYSEPFSKVGLNVNTTDTLIYTDIISTCLTNIYVAAKWDSFADDGTIPFACSRDVLFSEGALGQCIEAICAPRTLNADVAGIGVGLVQSTKISLLLILTFINKVISSFLIQSCIAVVAFTALLANEFRTACSTSPWTTYKNASVAALVDFHKSQCYFASTVQAVAIILFYNTQVAKHAEFQRSPDGFNIYDVLDSSTLVILATSGFVPTALTLACIERYGRRSWYLVALTLITWALATTTLASSTYYFQHNSNWDVDEAYWGSPTCSGGFQPLSEMLYPICGSSTLNANYLNPDAVSKYWAWLVWMYCTMWLLFFTLRAAAKSSHSIEQAKRFAGALVQNEVIRSMKNRFPVYFWPTILAAIWVSCFIFQIVLISIFFGIPSSPTGGHSVKLSPSPYGYLQLSNTFTSCIVILHYPFVQVNC